MTCRLNWPLNVEQGSTNRKRVWVRVGTQNKQQRGTRNVSRLSTWWYFQSLLNHDDKKKKRQKKMYLTTKGNGALKIQWNSDATPMDVQYPMAGTSFHQASDSPHTHLYLKWTATYLRLKNGNRARDLGRKSQRQTNDSLQKSYCFKVYSSSCKKSWAYQRKTLKELMSCLMLAK